MAVGAFLFGSGCLVGWMLARRQDSHSETELMSFHELRQGGYRFVNPLLECDFAEESIRGLELPGLKDKVNQYIERAKTEGLIDEAAVYFRQLRDGPWFGVNEHYGFAPASLMKIPLLMTYLKEADRDPALLRMPIVNDLDQNLAAGQFYPPKETIEPGRSYRVDDLLFRMVVYSDNNAWALLFRNIDTAKLNLVMRDLQVEYSAEDSSGKISIVSYSAFLRVLYNASYLSKEMSEKALSMLSQEDFSDGLRKGFPVNVMFAGKFGERTAGLDRGMVRQLHEVGIVYHPRYPYLLGVMTLGRDFKLQEKVLQDLSRLIYTETDIGTSGR